MAAAAALVSETLTSKMYHGSQANYRVRSSGFLLCGRRLSKGLTMKRLIRAASGVAVFIVTGIFGTLCGAALIYDPRLQQLRYGAFTEMVLILSVAIALSFVGAYFLITDSMKSK